MGQNNKKPDYQHIEFSPGIICFDSNNYNYCIVLRNVEGDMYENDKCSTVLELASGELRINSCPNRALVPTGQYFPIEKLKKILREGMMNE